MIVHFGLTSLLVDKPCHARQMCHESQVAMTCFAQNHFGSSACFLDLLRRLIISVQVWRKICLVTTLLEKNFRNRVELMTMNGLGLRFPNKIIRIMSSFREFSRIFD
jgi:hypothetical protein